MPIASKAYFALGQFTPQVLQAKAILIQSP